MLHSLSPLKKITRRAIPFMFRPPIFVQKNVPVLSSEFGKRSRFSKRSNLRRIGQGQEKTWQRYFTKSDRLNWNIRSISIPFSFSHLPYEKYKKVGTKATRSQLCIILAAFLSTSSPCPASVSLYLPISCFSLFPPFFPCSVFALSPLRWNMMPSDVTNQSFIKICYICESVVGFLIQKSTNVSRAKQWSTFQR